MPHALLLAPSLVAHCSLFHLLGAAGNPLGGALVCGDPEGGGAGRMGRVMGVCVFVVLEVRAGYGGRGGAELEPLVSWYWDSVAVGVSRFEGGERSRSRSFSLTTADEGAEGARYDLRLLCSIMLTAHFSRSTGVRFAACRKASWS